MAKAPGRKKRASPGAPSLAQAALMATGLTDMEQTFVLEYWRSMSAAKAYRIAFDIPWGPGVSTKLQGEALLRQPHIRDALENYRGNLRSNQALLRERTIEELSRIAFFNPANLYDDTGKLKMPHEMDPEDAAVLAGLETVELINDPKEGPIGYVRKVKWLDKVGAIKALLAAQGWNVEAQSNAQASSPIRLLLDRIQGRSTLPIVVIDHEGEA